MEFAIETILTIVTGVAFEKGLDNAKRLVGYMTGEPADEITFYIGERPKICKQDILRQYPQLEQVLKWKSIDRTNYDLVLEWAIDEVGNSLVIQPIWNMPNPEEYLGLV